MFTPDYYKFVLIFQLKKYFIWKRYEMQSYNKHLWRVDMTDEWLFIPKNEQPFICFMYVSKITGEITDLFFKRKVEIYKKIAWEFKRFQWHREKRKALKYDYEARI